MSPASFVELPGLRMSYALSGPASDPLVVLSHSLGTNLSLWEPQVTALEGRFRILRYDSRGHGRSSVAPGPYTLEQLGRDVLGLMDALHVARAHFCGLSVGGLVGIWLGVHARERIESLVLANTAARIGSAAGWNERVETVRGRGIAAIAGGALERWFTPGFRERSPEVFAAAARMLETTPSEGYLGQCAAIRDADLRAQLAAIACPTLVISGARDPATPPEQGRELASGIAGARYVELAASHLSNLEAADAFNAELLSFVGSPRI